MEIEVVKSGRRGHFCRIDTHAVEDPELSGLAKSLHLYILSRPEGWQLRMADIRKRFKEGRDCIERAIRELERAGYVQRFRRKWTDNAPDRKGGKFAPWLYIVHEMPVLEADRTYGKR